MNPNDPQTPPPPYNQPPPNYAPPQTPPPTYAYAPPPAGAPTTGSSGIPQGGQILIAYLLGWIGALIILAIEKNNQFVRFNALQSFITSLGVTVVYIALDFMEYFLPGIVALAVGCLLSLVGLAYVIGVIVVAIQAANGKMVRIPVAAEQADKLLPTFMR